MDKEQIAQLRKILDETYFEIKDIEESPSTDFVRGIDTYRRKIIEKLETPSEHKEKQKKKENKKEKSPKQKEKKEKEKPKFTADNHEVKNFLEGTTKEFKNILKTGKI
jgi:hypothetical protein